MHPALTKRTKYGLVAAGALGLLIYLLIGQQAGTFSTEGLYYTKSQLIGKAKGLVRAMGLTTDDLEASLQLTGDADAYKYLQSLRWKDRKALEREADLPIEFWEVKLKEGSTDKILAIVRYSNKGNLVGYQLKEPGRVKSKLSAVSIRAAKAIALEFLRNRAVFTDAGWDLKQSVSQPKDNIDYRFVWTRSDLKIKETVFKIVTEIAKGDLIRFEYTLVPPSQFASIQLTKILTQLVLGLLFSFTAFILMLFLLVRGILWFVKLARIRQIDWRYFKIFGGLFFVLGAVLMFQDGLPDLLKVFYWLLMSIGGGMAVATACSLLKPEEKSKLLWGFEGIHSKKWLPEYLTPALLIAYSMSFTLLGCQAIICYAGVRFFGVYFGFYDLGSGIYATSLPFVWSLTISAYAGIFEESMMRLAVYVILLRSGFKRWQAILFAVVVWAFMHAAGPVFPAYFRGIELTLTGLLFFAFLLKFGLLPAILGHFIIDLILTGYPLFFSKNPYLFGQGLILIAICVLPLAVGAAMLARRRFFPSEKYI